MIDFIIVGLPRSGTTWAANWLTDGTKTFCAHDPLYHTHYDEWGLTTEFPSRQEYENIGVSCTGIWRWPDWFQERKCKCLILERNIDEINDELLSMDYPLISKEDKRVFDSLQGVRIRYELMFDPDHARKIWKFLVGSGFCARRHAELVKMKIEPKFDKIKRNSEVMQKLYNELDF